VAFGCEPNTQTIIIEENNNSLGPYAQPIIIEENNNSLGPYAQPIIIEENNNSLVNTSEKVRKYLANSPCAFSLGINKFLKSLNITFHTQTKSKHNRPRINKLNSQKDKEQKAKNIYYES
jgi:hypothetical protein